MLRHIFLVGTQDLDKSYLLPPSAHEAFKSNLLNQNIPHQCFGLSFGLFAGSLARDKSYLLLPSKHEGFASNLLNQNIPHQCFGIYFRLVRKT
jgi:hypothetical protein